MRTAEKVFIALLAALAMGVALPAGNPAPVLEPVLEAPPAARAAGSPPKPLPDPSRADLLATMRPVIERMRESLGLPADLFNGDMSDKDRLDALVKEAQEPVSCAIDNPDRPRHFNFLLATVPDYVDSNTAWMADEVLGAIQAAMPHSGYVLDQFYLPEIPHNAGTAASTAVSSTATPRLHETQPGVIIFRGECGWQAVLIVLETATSGLHVAAFENAARFIALWQNRTLDAAQTDPTRIFRELRIIGPTFSGSVDVMVMSLKRVATAFESVHILSGSATADTNASKFAGLCQFKSECSYATAMHSNWTTVRQLCGFLREMNPSWVPGRVGVLQEYNTSFGMSFDLKADDPSGCSFRAYKFPLHIAQLRADTRAAPELPLLLTPPAVALKLGDRVRPADLVPPMRPDVASPLTDVSIAAMLDDIRHRGLAAVGIYATDIRDALFLSREIKRAVPDVQLFFPSAHLMYLHRDFVAYTRGAIVASTYPLSAMPQLWGGTMSPLREVFTSTVAQGVFIATLTQAARSGEYLPDYPYDARPTDRDSVGAPKLGPKPGIWLSIIGDDGFWPLRQVPYRAGLEMTGPLMNQWPRSVALASVLLALIVVAHAGAFLLNWNWSAGPHERARSAAKWAGRLRGLPILGALAPPEAFEEFGRLHRLMSAIVHILVGCLAFWMGSVIFVNRFGADSTMAAAVWLLPLAASTIAVLSSARVVSPWSTLPQVQARTIVRPFRTAEALVGACWTLPIAALLFSVISTYWRRGSLEPTAMLAAARTIGGGIASPGASTVCLLAVMYVPAFWSLRRLGALGYGYGTIARSSTAFKRLLGSEEGIASFASLLDVPARHLPRSYFFAIVLTMFVVTSLLLDNVATVEGTAYTLFLSTASLVGLGAALVFMAQSIETWRRLRVLLMAMADLPLAAALSRVGMSRLRWNISIFPPDTRDLLVPVGLAAELRDRIQDARVAALLGSETEVALDRVMHEDRRERQAAALTLTQSATWLRLWELSDALLPAVASCRWVKCGDKGVQGSVCNTHPSAVAACLDCCETLLATTRALVLRDITSRIMSGIFAAMVLLGLLATAHLLYVFQGRASLLTLDATVLGVASLVAVWILIGMEKDAILSLIWRTTPGRVSFNWALVQRLIVFGVLPLLAVLGSMFPEVGESVVRLLDPLRRLTSL